MKIHVDQRKLNKAMRKAPEKTQRTLVRILQAAAIMTQREARQEAPVHDGEYRRKINLDKGSGFRVVYPEAQHSPFIEYGTRPHFPPLRQGTGLHKWAVDHGLEPFAVAKGISRKGTKANPVFERTFNKVEKPITQMADLQIAKLVRSL